jgi:hypothetical protein
VDLYKKILSHYSTLNVKFFSMPEYVILQDDHDGNGAYIASWNHPTLSEPTQAELDAVTAEPTTEQLTWDDTWQV